MSSSVSSSSLSSSTTSIKDMYLILFNNACTTGWAMVWYVTIYSIYIYTMTMMTNQSTSISVSSLITILSEALSKVYNTQDGLLASILIFSQCMALLEIVHTMIGIVKSPIHVTIMQVMSRIIALVAIYFSPKAQSMFD
jgi:hypothetical protein